MDSCWRQFLSDLNKIANKGYYERKSSPYLAENFLVEDPQKLRLYFFLSKIFLIGRGSVA